VLEAARNVACVGGRPLAVTDCLNFGNPEKAEVAWELAEAIEGMALACEALGIPVVSGNVSLYNETDGRSIWPTPTVGCVGLVADVRLVPSAWQTGDEIYSVGAPELTLDGSEYQALFLGGPAGRPPMPELAAVGAVIWFVWRSGAVLTCSHDASEGGLAVALAEAALHAGIGARLELEEDAVAWFGEGGGQAIVSLSADDASLLESIPHRRLGIVGGDKLLGIPLPDLKAAYRGSD
jgi:phosphoribosylformylglycinamidine (FGAM) synthase-like enzyme